MSGEIQVTRKLLLRVRKWHAEWVVNPTLREVHLDESTATFNAYLDRGEEVAHLRSSCESLHFWHLVHFGHGLLSEQRADASDFALAARYARTAIEFSQAFANRDRGGDIVPNNAALYFAMNVLCGWPEEAALVGNALVKGLDTSMLDLRHTDRHTAGELYPNLWFLLQLYCNARGLPLDLTKYSYPPDMSPYAEVLADWRTVDQEKVSRWVVALADFHLKESKPAPGFESALFDGEDVILFPYEILTWLRLREWAGLENPAEFDHPLMKLPTARLPNPVPLPQPDTPLLDAVVAKFRIEFPGSF